MTNYERVIQSTTKVVFIQRILLVLNYFITQIKCYTFGQLLFVNMLHFNKRLIIQLLNKTAAINN